MGLSLLGVEARWADRSFRFEGENETVVLTLGDEITGGGGGGGGEGEDDKGFDGGGVEAAGILGLEAKKREITCCFCLPMFGQINKMIN